MYAKMDPAFQVVTSVFGPAEHKNNSHSGRSVRHTRSLQGKFIDNIPRLSMVNSILLVHLRMTASMYCNEYKLKNKNGGGLGMRLPYMTYVDNLILD